MLRLGVTARNALKDHFAALPAEDLRLRFGASLTADATSAYVDRIDFNPDSVFGVYDDALALVGVAHVAILDSTAELGVSVLPAHRRRGIGSALFARAVEYARNRSVPALWMHCMTENPAIMHMARRSGMRIAIAGGEADAHLALPSATLASITGEILTDRLALYDYAGKQQRAVWMRFAESIMQIQEGSLRHAA